MALVIDGPQNISWALVMIIAESIQIFFIKKKKTNIFETQVAE